MKTQVLSVEVSESCQEAAGLLMAGENVAFPTETVYGLGADARNSVAVDNILRIKERVRTDPIIVHIFSFEDVSRWISGVIPVAAEVLAAVFWPGPMTLLFDKVDHVLDEVTCGQPTVGLRVPRHDAALDILRIMKTKAAEGNPVGIAAPSANPHTKMSPTTAHHVLKGLGGKIPLILDGGWCEIGMESTIIDPRFNPVRILRAGDITPEDVRRVLAADERTRGIEVVLVGKHAEVVPGNMKAHYQVDTPTFLKSSDKINSSLRADPSVRVAVLHYSESFAQDDYSNAFFKRLPADRKGYQRAFFVALDEASVADVDQIWIEKPPKSEAWAAVWQHLNRAEHPEVLSVK